MQLQKDSFLRLRLFFFNSVKCILKPDKFLFIQKKESNSFSSYMYKYLKAQCILFLWTENQNLLFLIERFYWRQRLKRQSNGILAPWLANAI